MDYISMTSEFKHFYLVRIETTAADGRHLTLDEYAEWDGARWMIAPVPVS